MTSYPFRLDAPESHLFSGHQINRTKPIKFRLNGRTISGFKGDTILSALLASGISSAGSHQNYPIALSERLGLSVVLSEPAAPPGTIFPMDRTPALDGFAYTLSGTVKSDGLFGWIRGLGGRHEPTLGLDFDSEIPVPPPLSVTAQTAETIKADVVVIGGGTAGLAAAAHAAEMGKRVVLVERRPWLGGDAQLFGQTADEEAPDRIIGRLTASVRASERIEVLTHTEALSLSAQRLMAHQIRLSGDMPEARHIQITAGRFVIATGCEDRLPLFPGNRLPGIATLGSTFQLAAGYGVWPGQPAIILTNTNAAYRLALLAHDAGAPVDRLMDSRVAPQSRFAEFAKAYGVKSASGLEPQYAARPALDGPIQLQMALAWDSIPDTQEPFPVSAVIVSGGWVPRLDLWQQAGGQIHFDAKKQKIAAASEMERTRLAGSCAGYTGNPAVVQSGINAVRKLFDGKTSAISEKTVDSDFETPDGFCPVSRALEDENRAPAYFHSGSSLVAQRRAPQKRLFKPAPEARNETAAERALDLSDICALVATDNVMPGMFQDIAKERTVVAKVTLLSEAEIPDIEPPFDPRAMRIPLYLAGRFGEGAILREITASGGRRLETGNLIYANSDIDDPLAALGVVIWADGGEERQAVALMRDNAGDDGTQVSVKSSHGRSISQIGNLVVPI